jgi:hypothetical protein
MRMPFDVSQLAGPLGGGLAVAWGAGAAMGYGFAGKTIGKRVRELRDEMEKRGAKCDAKMAEMNVDYMKSIGDLTSRLREIEDRAFYGMQRQAGQVRDRRHI